MAAIKKLDTGQLVLSNAKYLHVTPWTDNDTIGDQTYDFVSIVGDTLAFTPDDNTVNEKLSEFTAAPLFETVTLGKIQFAANCIDFQNSVLTSMFGWKAVGSNGSAVAPSVYKDVYVTLEVGFSGTKTVVVVPKLKLNGKAIISTLKTGTAEGNLGGTAYNTSITIASESPVDTSMAFIESSKDSKYTIAAKGFTVGSGVDQA